MKPPVKICMVCRRPGEECQLLRPGNIVAVVTLCKDCRVDPFRIKEALRRIGVAA